MQLCTIYQVKGFYNNNYEQINFINLGNNIIIVKIWCLCVSVCPQPYISHHDFVKCGQIDISILEEDHGGAKDRWLPMPCPGYHD